MNMVDGENSARTEGRRKNQGSVPRPASHVVKSCPGVVTVVKSCPGVVTVVK